MSESEPQALVILTGIPQRACVRCHEHRVATDEVHAMNETELQALATLIGGRYFDGKVLKAVETTSHRQCAGCYLLDDRFPSSQCECPDYPLQWQPISFPTPQLKE